MEMRDFVRTALKRVAQKVREGSLDKHEEGYDDAEEMLLDWIWIELKEIRLGRFDDPLLPEKTAAKE